MALQLQNSNTPGELKVDTNSSAARVTQYNSAGVELGTSGNPLRTSVIPVAGLVNTYSAASWRIVGTTTTTQPLMTIRNNSGARDIRIRRLAIDVNYSAAAVFLTQAYFRFWTPTGVVPSGGAAPTKWSYDTQLPASQAATEILFAASADGVASAITHATPGSTPSRQQGHPNILTAAGAAFNSTDFEIQTFAQEPLIISPNEVGALILICSANNIATQHYTVKIVWEEATI